MPIGFTSSLNMAKRFKKDLDRKVANMNEKEVKKHLKEQIKMYEDIFKKFKDMFYQKKEDLTPRKKALEWTKSIKTVMDLFSQNGVLEKVFDANDTALLGDVKLVLEKKGLSEADKKFFTSGKVKFEEAKKNAFAALFLFGVISYNGSEFAATELGEQLNDEIKES